MLERLTKVLLLLVLPLALFAEEPSTINTFVDVLVGLMKGKVGWIFIGIILGFSAYFAWKNGNLTPLLWGTVAALIIGAAPYVGPEITSWGNSTFGG